GEMEDMADMVEWTGDYQYYVQLKKELEQKLVAAEQYYLRSISPRYSSSFKLLPGSVLICGTNATCKLPREPLLIVQCNVTPVQLLHEENNQTVAFALRRGGII